MQTLFIIIIIIIIINAIHLRPFRVDWPATSLPLQSISSDAR